MPTPTEDGALVSRLVELLQTANGKEDEDNIIAFIRDERIAIDVNHRCQGGWGLLHMCGVQDLPRVARVLLDESADPVADDGKGNRPLHYAVHSEALDVVKVLLDLLCDSKADVNATTEDHIIYVSSIPIYQMGGRTALHTAVEVGTVECARLLLDGGVDPKKEDNSGRTAYDLACNLRRTEMCELLCSGSEHMARKPQNTTADNAGIKLRVTHNERRKRREYREMIACQYTPKHADLYELKGWGLQTELREAIEAGARSSLSGLVEEVHPGISRFPALNVDFCSRLVDELEHFEHSGLPVKRPNSMNNYGVILNDIGLGDVVTELLEGFINPLASELFPEDGGGSLDHHHSFAVKYKRGEDVSLDVHVDDADVTLNVCLGKCFTRGSLGFFGTGSTCSSHEDVVHHVPGYALLHSGKHWHCAESIESGERWNLIVWCRSSEKRGKPLVELLADV